LYAAARLLSVVDSTSYVFLCYCCLRSGDKHNVDRAKSLLHHLCHTFKYAFTLCSSRTRCVLLPWKAPPRRPLRKTSPLRLLRRDYTRSSQSFVLLFPLILLVSF